jgi:hypothetical protein
MPPGEPVTLKFHAVIVVNVALVLKVPLPVAPSVNVAVTLKSAAHVAVAAKIMIAAIESVFDISSSPSGLPWDLSHFDSH